MNASASDSIEQNLSSASLRDSNVGEQF